MLKTKIYEACSNAYKSVSKSVSNCQNNYSHETLKPGFIYRKANYRNKGMSLIELLVGIAIVGTLSAIAIPNLLGARNKAKEATCESLYNPALTQLTNDLENKLNELDSTNATSVVVDNFLKYNAYEKNPYNQKQKAYVMIDTSNGAVTRPEQCQVGVFTKNGWRRIIVGQTLNNTTYRVDVIKVN